MCSGELLADMAARLRKAGTKFHCTSLRTRVLDRKSFVCTSRHCRRPGLRTLSGRTVAYETKDTYAFGFRAVQDKAPNMSGVYTIYTSRRWLYVGESDDVKQSLFTHLNEPSTCLARRGPLSFSFELVPAVDRASRQQALIRALAPACQHIDRPITARAAESGRE